MNTAIDLFCGAGGLTCGLKQANYSILSAVEIDPLAAYTFSKNHPEVNLFEKDILSLNPKDIMEQLNIAPNDLDLLAGCPPCQGFSSLRTKNKSSSVYDKRNDLVYEFLNWVKIFLPKCVLLENVPALAKDKRMLHAKKELLKLGYHIDDNSLKIEDIAEYGIPQRRRRMILVASKFGEIQMPKKEKITSTVRQTIGNIADAGNSGDYLHDIPENRSTKIKNLIENIPKDGGSRADLPKKHWLECHKRYPKGFKDVYGRMSWDCVSPTITGGCHNPSKGRFLHPIENRAITLREAALLQTFPSDYFFSLKRGKENAALMIGNALPPKFIKKQGIAIKKHIKKHE